MSESTGIIESDAPVDNTAYGRENGEWVATFAAVEMNLFVQQVNTNAQVARSAELAAKDAAIAANNAVNLVQQETQNAQIARNAAEAAANNAAGSQQQANADALATQNALLATQQIKTDVQTLRDSTQNAATAASSSAAGQLDSIATEGAKQIAQAKSQADKAALSEQASSESATRSESAAKRAEELVDQATGGALLKDQNLGDVPNKEAARTHLDVPSKSQLAQAISEAIGAVTPASIGARPDSWIPTAADVGAVAKAGDTMTGNLTTPKVLVSGAQGTEINALTRKDYVDTELSKKLSLAGGTMTGNLTVPAVNLSGSQSSAPNTVTRKDYVDSAIAAAIGGVTPESIGARPDSWLPSLEEIGAAASADLNPLIPAASASFVYTGSTLTQMTEQLIGGERVTSFAYTDGRLTSAVEVLGLVTKTTTYNYQAGILTGLNVSETAS